MSSKTKVQLKKHKTLDKIYHVGTGLVLKSQTEKIIVGRIVDDEFVGTLDAEAVELCKQNNFKYDASLCENAEETEEQAEEQTEEQEDAGEDQEETESKGASKEEATEEEVKVEPKKETKKTKADTKPEVVKETKQETKPEVKKSAPASTSLPSEFSSLLTSLQEFTLSRQEKLAESENTISALRKELDDVKKKLKGVLTAMQGEL